MFHWVVAYHLPPSLIRVYRMREFKGLKGLNYEDRDVVLLVFGASDHKGDFDDVWKAILFG